MKKKIKWEWYTRGTIQPYRADIVFKGIKKYAASLNLTEFYSTYYINIKNKLWWGWSEKELKNLGKKIFLYCSNKKNKENHLKKIQYILNKAFKASDKVRNLNLRKLDSNELIKNYLELIKQTAPAHGMLDADVDAVDFISEKRFKSIIKKNIKIKNVNFNEIYSILSKPIYESFSKKEEKYIISLSSKNKITKKDILKLYNNFWWTKVGWENMTPYKIEHFYQLINKFKKNKNLQNIILENNKYVKNLVNERELLIKKYNINKKIYHWLDFFDKYTEIHEKRKEMQAKSVYAFYLLLKEVSHRKQISINKLEWLFFDEIIDILKGKKVDYNLIKQRQKAVGVRITKNSYDIFNGNQALKEKNKEIKQHVRNKIIRGTIAYKGLVIGKVKVCSGADEALKKIKKGDILVCGMTLPDYIVAMRKAAAIVTNEGGITCHAAIISRELKIPCIIGTKIATQILKDGDKIEVDANQGLIKKLSK